MYIGNDLGDLLIFQHGKEKKLLKTIEFPGPIRATPTVSNGVLYVISQQPCKLYAIGK